MHPLVRYYFVIKILRGFVNSFPVGVDHIHHRVNEWIDCLVVENTESRLWEEAWRASAIDLQLNFAKSCQVTFSHATKRRGFALIDAVELCFRSDSAAVATRHLQRRQFTPHYQNTSIVITVARTTPRADLFPAPLQLFLLEFRLRSVDV